MRTNDTSHSLLITDDPEDFNKLSTVCLPTAVPHSPRADEHLTGCTVGKALFLSMVFMTVLGCIAYVVMWLKKKQKGKRDPLERGCVAQGKHPNVVRSFMTIICSIFTRICSSATSEITCLCSHRVYGGSNW